MILNMTNRWFEELPFLIIKPHKSNLINVIQCDNTMNLKCLLSERLELRT